MWCSKVPEGDGSGLYYGSHSGLENKGGSFYDQVREQYSRNTLIPDINTLFLVQFAGPAARWQILTVALRSCSGNFFYHGPCSKKDDTFINREYYKIIVGSATDKKDCLLYRNEGGLF